MYARFVALGDSTTEGMNDPDGRGGYRGWADRLAERLAELDPATRYANFAVRGRVSGQVLEGQLAPAVALRPDLASVEVGMNDALRPRFDAAVVAGCIDEMVGALTAAGARVLTFTMPDPTPFLPIGRVLRPRLLALNDAIRAVAARHDAAVVDLGAHTVASDPRLWSVDRLHGNALGHARIAAAAAEALGLPGSGPEWTLPLPPLPPRGARERLAAERAWWRDYFLPWVSRHARGRSSGDGREPKRPQLRPVIAAAAPTVQRAGADGP